MNLDAENRRKAEILRKLSEGPQRWDPQTLSDADLAGMKQGASAYDNVRPDAGYKSAQQDTMNRFGQIADRGYSDSEQAAMMRLRSEANRDDGSRRAAILQQMNMRGGGGGGASLAAQLSSADSAHEREAQGAADAAAKGQERSLQALREKGSMARELSNDDYTQQARAAEAKDNIARFNSGLTQQFMQNRNQMQNSAGQFNANTGNEWNMKTSGLNYDDAVQEQNRKIAEDQDNKKRKSQRNNAMGRAVGTVGGGAIGAYMGGPGGAMAGAKVGATAGDKIGGSLGDYFSDERLKDNIDDVDDTDIDQFLESLHPKKFKYKDPDDSPDGDDDSEHVGFLAQDMEHNPIGSKVIKDTEHGKMVESDNLMGAIIASIKRLEEKKRDK